MTRARSVLNAIDDALIIHQRHPALFARMSNAGRSCRELSLAFDAYTAGVTSQWWFVGEHRNGADRTWRRERAIRRARGKRQRAARKANR